MRTRTKQSFTFNIYQRYKISADEVADYIAVGRAKVIGTDQDPYKHLPKSSWFEAIHKDADFIAKEYNQAFPALTFQKSREWLASIYNIQHGPKNHQLVSSI